MIEKINNTLTKVKELIKNNKMQDALTLLCSLSIKKKDPLYDDVIFEKAKIFMISEDYFNSLKLLKKISKIPLLYYAEDMIFKIYKITKKRNLLLNFCEQLIRFGRYNKENIIDAIKNSIVIKKYKKTFNFIKIYEQKFNKDEYIKLECQKLYNSISIDIQKYNIENKYEKTKKFFKMFYDLIPNNEIRIKNILLNEYEIATGKIKLESKPRQLTVVLTDKCNLKCIMCKGIHKKRKEYELSGKHYKNVLEVIPYLQRLILHGGEVFLYKEFFDIVNSANNNNVDLEIVTNGLLLNEQNLSVLFGNNNLILTISIDAFDKKTYEKIRCGANWNKLIEKINLVNEFRKRTGKKIRLILQMVVMKSNYEQIETSLQFAEKYNFDTVQLTPIRSGVSIKEECIFDIAYDYKILKYLDDNRDRFYQIAKDLNVELINGLPKRENLEKIFFELLAKNSILYKSLIKLKSFKNLDDILIYITDKIKDKKSIKYINKIISKVQQNKLEFAPLIGNNRYIKLYEQPVLLEQKNIKNNLFCFLPWKNAYFDGCDLLPTCFCPRISFKKCRTEKSILSLWNSGLILHYRKRIIEDKKHLICNSFCISNKILIDKKRSLI